MMDPKQMEGAQATAQQTAAPQADILTTEEFHRLLEENTVRHADERTRHQKMLAEISLLYQQELDHIGKAELEVENYYRSARQAFEKAKDKYNADIRMCAKLRNKAGSRKNLAQAEEANRWTLNNNIIQSDRHNIFERFRNSGGVLAGDASELLHPSWSRDKKKLNTKKED